MSISVKICSGTACYIMGGASLLHLSDALTPAEREQVHIEASPCLKVCNDYGPQTPYAQINGEIIPSATPDLLLQKIRSLLAEKDARHD